MQTLSNELRSVIETRLRQASPRTVLAIASALCDEEAGAQGTPASSPSVGARFSLDGDTVRDAQSGLIWTRNTLPGGRRKWADAKKVAEECRAGGFIDWRLPTIQELLSIVDYERSEPSTDPMFECESSWYWTATPCASSPSVCAWGVCFGNGYSFWDGQNYEGFVRAVRPGQIIGNLG